MEDLFETLCADCGINGDYHQYAFGTPHDWNSDTSVPAVKSATVAPDKKSVRLVIDGLVRDHVHQLKATGVKSASGQALWYPEAFYTLNEIPAQ